MEERADDVVFYPPNAPSARGKAAVRSWYESAIAGATGFLLRVTDVEHQPFRSMGFVSVLIVSGLFALGLPFVLLTGVSQNVTCWGSRARAV